MHFFLLHFFLTHYVLIHFVRKHFVLFGTSTVESRKAILGCTDINMYVHWCEVHRGLRNLFVFNYSVDYSPY
jgi:hypothetical protein